jgi:hypothetical protein
MGQGYARLISAIAAHRILRQCVDRERATNLRDAI